jgi:hypothetical protein
MPGTRSRLAPGSDLPPVGQEHLQVCPLVVNLSGLLLTKQTRLAPGAKPTPSSTPPRLPISTLVSPAPRWSWSLVHAHIVNIFPLCQRSTSHGCTHLLLCSQPPSRGHPLFVLSAPVPGASYEKGNSSPSSTPEDSNGWCRMPDVPPSAPPAPSATSEPLRRSPSKIISLATNSVRKRFLPSWSSQLRVCKRPSTYTCCPL